MRFNRSPQKPIIGIDVGGTRIATCLVDLQGKILSSIRRPAEVDKPDATLVGIGIVSVNLGWKNVDVREGPQAVVISGGAVLSSSLLFESIQQMLHELGNSSRVFGKVFASDLVRLPTLGNIAGVLGAAALVAPQPGQE